MTRRKGSSSDKRKRRRRPPRLANRSPADDQLARSDPAASLPSWIDDAGVHSMLPVKPDPAMLQRMTELYQQNIRNSPLWDQMVSEFGLEKAERLLKEFRAQPG